MAKFSTRDLSPMQQRLVIAAVVVIILASVAWLGINLMGDSKPVYTPPQDYAKFVNKARELMASGPFAGVEFRTNDEGKSVLVFGEIRTQADLDKLKSLLNSIEPKLPVKYDLHLDTTGSKK